jgi:hypothetical protein
MRFTDDAAKSVDVSAIVTTFICVLESIFMVTKHQAIPWEESRGFFAADSGVVYESDIGREELQKADARLVAGGDQDRESSSGNQRGHAAASLAGRAFGL